MARDTVDCRCALNEQQRKALKIKMEPGTIHISVGRRAAWKWGLLESDPPSH